MTDKETNTDMIRAEDAAARVAAELGEEEVLETDLTTEEDEEVDVNGFTKSEREEFEEENKEITEAKNETVTTEKKSLDLGTFYEPRKETTNQSQQLSEETLQRIVDQKLKEVMQAKAKIDETENTEDKTSQKSEEEMKKMLREVAIKEYQNMEQARNLHNNRLAVREDYLVRLEDKLNQAGIETENDNVLCEWIVGTFDHMVNQEAYDKQRHLTPDEIAEVANKHAKEVSKKLNLRQPNYKPEKKAVAGAMNAAVSKTTEKKATNQEQLNDKYIKMAEKQGGKLSPSQRTKYLHEKMKLSGVTKMKF